MGETLSNKKNQVVVTEVVRMGEKIVLPTGMKCAEARKILEAREQYEETKIEILRTLNTFVWDGANALAEALDEKFGWAQAVKDPSFWDEGIPKLITMDVGLGKTKQIPWGKFTIPGIDGFVKTDAIKKEGRWIFQATATVKRKHEEEMHELFQLMEEKLAKKSIYRGKAIAIRFKDENGNNLPLPEPKFMDVAKANPKQLILPREVKTDIVVNLFTPIERMPECKALGIPVKRGVLLAGNFGVGKTLAARIAGKLAVENGITYVYCQRADEFADVVEFAKQYQPAVVFCEDIDRVLQGNRDQDMDHILNTIDGIDNKDADIIVVLTSNSMEKINAAMLRPGRLDAVIWVAEPDADAVVQLIRLYGGKLTAKESDEALLEVGRQLAGNIPSVIREVVERSKLAALSLLLPGQPLTAVNAEALKAAAHSMKVQLDLLHAKQNEKPEPSDMEVLGNVLGEYISFGVGEALKENGATGILRRQVAKKGVRMNELEETVA